MRAGVSMHHQCVSPSCQDRLCQVLHHAPLKCDRVCAMSPSPSRTRRRPSECLSRTRCHPFQSIARVWLTAALVVSLFASDGHSSGYDPYASYKSNGASYPAAAPYHSNGYGQSSGHSAGYQQPQSAYGAYSVPDYQAPYIPYRKYYKQYLPAPQFCPETGRTVCSKVAPFYPTDEVFSVIKMARAKRFNISSEFVDESQNDSEPHFEHEEPWPEPEPFFNLHHPGTHQLVSGGHGHAFGGGAGGLAHHSGGLGGHQQQQAIAHFHNFDYKPYFSSGDKYRATVAPYHQAAKQAVYGSSSYSGPHGYSASASASAAIATHQRYKRQTSGGGGGGGSANELPIEPVCASRIILIEPKAGLNDKRQWKFVINLSERDPRLKQAIKVEVCLTPNQPCSNQISLPFGFISRCKQKYIKKKLISLDSTGQSISSENFFSPSCCVCEVIRNVNGSPGGTSNANDNAAAASTLNETKKKKRKRKK